MSERDDLAEQVYHQPALFEPETTTEELVPDPGHEIWDFASSATRGFDFMLDMQRAVEAAWGRTVDPTDGAAVSAYIRDVILCATDELHEVLGEVNWKPWKDTRGIKDVAAYREEMADVLHFILDLYLAAGLTGQDIIVDYMAKHYKNIERVTNAEYRQS